MVSSKVAELWSAELSLMPTQKLDGTTFRISDTISRTILARFSGVPPYASVRRFVCTELVSRFAVVERFHGASEPLRSRIHLERISVKDSNRNENRHTYQANTHAHRAIQPPKTHYLP